MKRILFLFLFPLSIYSQTVIDNFTFTDIPQDKQLYARNSSDKGTVVIAGEYDKSGSAPDYTLIQIRVERNGSAYGSSPHNQTLNYSGDIATFNFSIDIQAETDQYSFEILARNGSWNSITTVEDVVAGDVYVIQGQSNAVAKKMSGSTTTLQSDYIRVYANGTDSDADLLANDQWYIGQGDNGRGSDGNTGQWGLKLARMLVDSKDVPVAIFNGARGAKPISYFLENAANDSGQPTNNYERLLYRLNKTGLTGAVKAVLWSQGENVTNIYNVNDYKNYFEDLRSSWKNDFPNVEQFYIFQTVNGCTAFPNKLDRLMFTKEAQRLLDEEYDDVHIMNTDGLEQFYEITPEYYCHFVYTNGYEGFAERIYPLVFRDFYGGTSINIEAPKILSATLTNDTTLEIQTDVSNLYLDGNVDTFELADSNGESITGVSVSGGKIIFTLSGNPGANASISNLGSDPGESDGLVRAISNDLEIVSFYDYPITISIPNTSIMITQYYEGATVNNRWIEVKNISGSPISANTYYLALYKDTSIPNIGSSTPDEEVAIPAMTTDEVILFRRSSSATAPGLTYRNPAATIINNQVCNFTGNDVVLISLTNNSSCYVNRQDIIGTVPVSNWGPNTSFLRGENAIPEKDFVEANWIEFNYDEIDNADPYTNMALGTYGMGPTIWNGSSWSSEEPDQTRTVEVSGDYEASDGTFRAGDLTVTGNLDFDGNTTNSIVVYGDLSIAGGGSFTIGDKESLVMYKDAATITGEITKLESSTLRSNLHDMTYWAATIKDAKISDAFPGVDPTRIFYYDQSQSTETTPGVGDYWNVWVNAPQNMTMTPGLGFAAEGAGTGVHNISLTGKPNNGDILVDVVYQSGSGNDFNLIGNPYPSAIDMAEFFMANSNIVGAAYLWTHNTQVSAGGDFTPDDYATVNSTGGTQANTGGPIPTPEIGSSQGFFVSTTTNSGKVEFNNSMRIEEANGQFFKQSLSKSKEPSVIKSFGGVKDRIWLNLTTDEGGFSQILLGYRKKLTNKVDHGYDAPLFTDSNNPISFYSVIEKEKYVIQAQRTFVEQRKARLGFDTTVAPRMFKISIAKAEGALTGIDVFLVDRHLNKTHNLSESDYSFLQLTTGEFKYRFILTYSETNPSVANTSSVNNDSKFKVYNESQGIVVESNEIIRKFRVFNIYGKRYITIRPNKNFFVVKGLNWVKSGSLLIVEATFENGQVISKKIVKH